MSAVIAGVVLFLACYGLLTILTETLAAGIRKRLRQLGHDTHACDICTGRQLRKHQAHVIRDA